MVIKCKRGWSVVGMSRSLQGPSRGLRGVFEGSSRGLRSIWVGSLSAKRSKYPPKVVRFVKQCSKYVLDKQEAIQRKYRYIYCVSVRKVLCLKYFLQRKHWTEKHLLFSKESKETDVELRSFVWSGYKQGEIAQFVMLRGEVCSATVVIHKPTILLNSSIVSHVWYCTSSRITYDSQLFNFFDATVVNLLPDFLHQIIFAIYRIFPCIRDPCV